MLLYAFPIGNNLKESSSAPEEVLEPDGVGEPLEDVVVAGLGSSSVV